MTEYNYGDRVSATDLKGGGVIEGWIVPENPDDVENSERLFVNFVDPNPEVEGMAFTFDTMLEDENIKIEIVETLAEQVPNAPGEYVFEDFEDMRNLMLSLGLDGAVIEPDIWTVDEEGVLRDPDGEQGETYIIASMGLKLVPYVAKAEADAEADAE